MSKRLLSSLVGVVLVVLSGAASAQCENMVVIVRNSVYPINGLDAFCQEFNKMKADLAGMKSALSEARQKNAMLERQLESLSVESHAGGLAQLQVLPRRDAGGPQ